MLLCFFYNLEESSGRPNIAKNVMSRAEYIQQLRSLYQQTHRQRNGVYPLDAEEEAYERQLQEIELRVSTKLKQYIHIKHRY